MRGGLPRSALDLAQAEAALAARRGSVFARMTTARVRPGQTAEAARIVRETILPTARAQPGFAGFLQLGDATSGRLLILTLWDSEEAMEVGEEAGYYRAQLATLEAVLRGQPTRETFAVEACELPG